MVIPYVFLGTGVAIEPENLKAFYECWKDNETTCRDMEITLSSKSIEFSDATVLKVGLRWLKLHDSFNIVRLFKQITVTMMSSEI